MSSFSYMRAFRSDLKSCILHQSLSNFIEWSRRLRKVIIHEHIEYVLLNDPPKVPKDSDPDEDKLQYDEYMIHSLEVKSLMLHSIKYHLKVKYYDLRTDLIYAQLRLFMERLKGHRNKMFHDLIKMKGGLDLGDKRCLYLKEMQAQEYLFFDTDIPGMFDEQLKAKVIELLEPKHPEKENRSIEPYFCKYHRVLSHPKEKCFIFKEKVMDLARQGEILLEEDQVFANHITLTIIRPTEFKIPDGF
ncbi:hypothetical protein LIER_12910 [Lithospermum erythrorhizon]|uniref:Retrotransposon gag protein n=1 Tax=Lithospermum erythrorhizon TaxID=34254 RepID=A0AAV3PYP2_LITER